MSSTDSPTWWADVQQDRDDLVGQGRRKAEDWLGEEIDFVPRRRMRRGASTDALHGAFVPVDALRDAGTSRTIELGGADDAPAPTRTIELTGGDAPARTIELTGGDAPARTIELTGDPVREAATAMTIELTGDVSQPAGDDAVAHELAHLSAADDPFATPPPPPGQRRMVHIKGRPGESRLPSMARRHRPRTASDRVGHRPDRIALWAVALGAILILLAAMTSSSQAATLMPLPQPAAQITHVAAPQPAPPAIVLR